MSEPLPMLYCLLHDCEFIVRCPYWHEGDPVGVAELEPGRPKEENLYVPRARREDGAPQP